jgi:hypothetical protein
LYDVFSFATWIFFLTSITIPIEIQRQLWHAVDVDAHSSGESTSANENNGQSPRKRSRKGKAFKLDRLCLKLQDKHADMEYDSENEEESEFLEENDDIGQLQIDESRNIDEGGSIEPNDLLSATFSV